MASRLEMSWITRQSLLSGQNWITRRILSALAFAWEIVRPSHSTLISILFYVHICFCSQLPWNIHDRT